MAPVHAINVGFGAIADRQNLGALRVASQFKGGVINGRKWLSRHQDFTAQIFIGFGQ
jgi:hypothetical protein